VTRHHADLPRRACGPETPRTTEFTPAPSAGAATLSAAVAGLDTPRRAKRRAPRFHRPCAACGEVFVGRPNRRFCSGGCRTRACRARLATSSSPPPAIRAEAMISDKTREREEMFSSMVHFLGRFNWKLLATLTFAQPRSETSAKRALRDWIEDLSLGAPERVGWIAFYEKSRARSCLHIHALIITDVTPAIALRCWGRRGRAQIENYDPRRGIRHYLSTKYIRGCDDWDLDGLSAQDAQRG